MAEKRVIVVHPHGFCAGVARAVTAGEEALKRGCGPVYCLHELVHNTQVVSELAARGMRFVERLEDVPPGAIVLFSAHGVTPSAHATARERQLRVIDATCPFVAKVHQEVRKFASEKYTVICIGHRKHDEVVGVVGEAPDRVVVVENSREAQQVEVADPNRVAVVTQTTLSPNMVDDIRTILRERFPALREAAHGDVCYATRNRQQAVRSLAACTDLVLVLGSSSSSNSRRLVETAQETGGRATLIGTVADLHNLDLGATHTLGITSGASTPASFLQETLAFLQKRGFSNVEHLHAVAEREMVFAPPPSLAAAFAGQKK